MASIGDFTIRMGKAAPFAHINLDYEKDKNGILEFKNPLTSFFDDKRNAFYGVECIGKWGKVVGEILQCFPPTQAAGKTASATFGPLARAGTIGKEGCDIFGFPNLFTEFEDCVKEYQAQQANSSEKRSYKQEIKNIARLCFDLVKYIFSSLLGLQATEVAVLDQTAKDIFLFLKCTAGGVSSGFNTDRAADRKGDAAYLGGLEIISGVGTPSTPPQLKISADGLKVILVCQVSDTDTQELIRKANNTLERAENVRRNASITKFICIIALCSLGLVNLFYTLPSIPFTITMTSLASTAVVSTFLTKWYTPERIHLPKGSIQLPTNA